MLRVKDPKVSLAFYQDVRLKSLCRTCAYVWNRLDHWNGPPFWYNSSSQHIISFYLTCDAEKKFNDFTLYFLAFNHEGRDLTKEEKEASRFSREGSPQHSNNIPPSPVS